MQCSKGIEFGLGCQDCTVTRKALTTFVFQIVGRARIKGALGGAEVVHQAVVGMDLEAF